MSNFGGGGGYDGGGGYGDSGGNWSGFGGGVAGYGNGAISPIGYSMHDQAMAGITGPQAAALGYSGTSNLADAMASGTGGGYSMHDQRMANLTGLQATGFGPLGTQQMANYQGGQINPGMGGYLSQLQQLVSKPLRTGIFAGSVLGPMGLIGGTLAHAMMNSRNMPSNQFSKPSSPGSAVSGAVAQGQAGSGEGGISEGALLNHLAAAMTTGKPQAQGQAQQPRANGLLDLYRQMYG
jgi:hypothetical protein